MTTTTSQPDTLPVFNDPVLDEVVRRVGLYRLRRTPDAWEALASAVVYQQVSGKAAVKIVDEMRFADGKFPSPRDVCQYGWESWKQCGMTDRKARTLVLLASDVNRGALNLGMLAEKHEHFIVQTLTRYPGVGMWTAEMWMVFHLGREDIFMPGDLGLRKAIRSLYGLAETPTAGEAATFALRWKGRRTIASWYLWRSDPKFPEPGFASAGGGA